MSTTSTTHTSQHFDIPGTISIHSYTLRIWSSSGSVRNQSKLPTRAAIPYARTYWRVNPIDLLGESAPN